MANDNFRRSGANPDARADSSISGYISDAGPYEAIVVGIVEGSRMGQLLVDIIDWQGAVTEIGSGDVHAIPVSYASPFYGTTFNADSQKLPDAPIAAAQSYGMWFVPPDIGNKILVTFVAGDLSRGYWFACIYDTPTHHMVPAIARNVGGRDRVLNPSDSLTDKLTSDTIAPVTEANTADKALWGADGIEDAGRYPHEIQTSRLVAQGLDRDPIRGAISSSSLRESPSNVYGISTPGRKLSKDNGLQTAFIRAGGHQFVMDDGDKDGKDQLMRLRTSGGHQILMNDSEHVLYIASDTGQQWIEFSPNGSINIYGAAGINMRSMGPINMHSDSAINMQAGSIKLNGTMSVGITSMGSFSASAVTSASVKANGMLSLSGAGKTSLTSGAVLTVSAMGACSVAGSMLSLNGAKPSFPSPALPELGKTHIEADYNGTYWQEGAKVTNSICTVVPAHEPWERPAKK